VDGSARASPLFDARDERESNEKAKKDNLNTGWVLAAGDSGRSLVTAGVFFIVLVRRQNRARLERALRARCGWRPRHGARRPPCVRSPGQEGWVRV